MTSISNGMAIFWVMLGFMAGIAVAFLTVHMWRGSHSDSTSTSSAPHNRRWIIVGSALFLTVAVVVYGWVGKPTSAVQATATSTSVVAHSNATGTPGSMAEVTAKLAAKLAAQGGSDADWQLLQQSYEFLGDSNAAELAKQHRVADTAASAAVSAAAAVGAPEAKSSSLATYQQRTSNNPNDAAAWLAMAELHRTARDFAKASEAFDHVIKLKEMDAASWADYADVQGSLAGSLSNPAARHAIDAALKLDARHTKALWLKASLAYEEKRYAQALQVWQLLRSVIPAGSPDIAIVDANIAEAGKLAGVSTANSSSTVAATVQGTVKVDAALRTQASNGMTLFIYAKADDSPAPVAAYRGVVDNWPVSFVLDDRNAMMPTRKLSQYAKVMLEARLSRSGQAMAQSGDLQADAVMVDTRSGQPVTLNISRRVP